MKRLLTLTSMCLVVLATAAFVVFPVPTSIVAVSGNKQVMISWKAVPAATWYRVVRGTVPGVYTTSFRATTTTYTDTTVTNGIAYYYVVAAFGPTGSSGISAAVSATPTAPVIVNPLAQRTLVVVNARYPDSQVVADYYRLKRDIPAENVCTIDTDDGDGFYMPGGLAAYRSALQLPIQACLTRIGVSKILYIVFSARTPFKVYGQMGSSTDSLIAYIWFDPIEGVKYPNPYFDVAQPLGEYRDTHVYWEPYYSVWRLDARTTDKAKNLVDLALAGEQRLTGQGCFDRRYDTPNPVNSGFDQGEYDIQHAESIVRGLGYQTTYDLNLVEIGTPPAPLRCDNVAFFWGWYSYGEYHDVFTFARGAIGLHLDSASLWSPRNPDTSWGGGAIEHGITITSGAMGEPYLTGLPHGTRFFSNLATGHNVGDAMLAATEFLQWRIINVGDPLYRPNLRP